MLASARRFVALVAFAGFVSFGCRFASAAEPAPSYLVQIADVGKSAELASILTEKGYLASVPQKNMWVADPQSNCAVWIGKNVPLEMLRDVLAEAIRFNPYLKFFHLVGDRGEQPPEQVDNTIHIGGSIEAALVKKLNQIESAELLDTLNKAKSLEEVHRYLHEKNLPKPSATDKPA